MSLSPEGRRVFGTLTRHIYAAARLRAFLKPRNWPSEMTLNTNRLNERPVGSFGLSLNPPAARRSPARLKEAFSWWFARAETRRIIERMMQP